MDRPVLEAVNVAEARIEVAKKITAMENKAATAYYLDDDSINTMEEGTEIVSLSGKSTTFKISISTNKNLISNIKSNHPLYQITDDRSIASSIT